MNECISVKHWYVGSTNMNFLMLTSSLALIRLLYFPHNVLRVEECWFMKPLSVIFTGNIEIRKKSNMLRPSPFQKMFENSAGN